MNKALAKKLRWIWNKWKYFMRHEFLKILFFYGLVNVVMVFGYIAFEQWIALSLKPDLPSTDPPAEAASTFFLLTLLILPLTLLLEDLGLRFMPSFFIHGVFRLDTIEVKPIGEDWKIADKRKWRVWLYHNHRSFYIVVSALWHSLLHQGNVFAANPLGSLVYFGIQLVIGVMLAWIYIRKGFWQSYTVHVSWDFLLIGFMSLVAFLSSL